MLYVHPRYTLKSRISLVGVDVNDVFRGSILEMLQAKSFYVSFCMNNKKSKNLGFYIPKKKSTVYFASRDVVKFCTFHLIISKSKKK